MELPCRKQIRLKGYDCSSNGAYFITICTQNNLKILGDVGDGFPVPCAPPSKNSPVPFVKLNTFGEIVGKYIQKIPDKYSAVTVDKYIIMPNHVHMLIMILNKTESNRAGSHEDHGTGNPSPTVGTIVGWFKYQTTKIINAHNNDAGTKIWQRSYHDHIIRNETEYSAIWEYIDENPAKWSEDKYYCGKNVFQ